MLRPRPGGDDMQVGMQSVRVGWTAVALILVGGLVACGAKQPGSAATPAAVPAKEPLKDPFGPAADATTATGSGAADSEQTP